MFSFGKKHEVDPKEQMKEWKRNLRKEKRGLERQIRGIEREENKVKREIKKAAKSGDMDVVRMLAKEIIRSKNAKNRIRTSVVTLNSVELQLTQNFSMMKVSGALSQSAGVMSAMSQAVNVPGVMTTMRNMAKEMERAGVIEEMTSDMLDDVLDEEDMSSEAEEEVSKVMADLLGDKFKDVAVVPTTPVATPAAAAPAPAVGGKVEEEDGEIDAMRSRLAALDAL